MSVSLREPPPMPILPLLARTAGPFYGDIDAGPGALLDAVDTVAGRSGSELILLHADYKRFRLLVNLIAQLNACAQNCCAVGFFLPSRRS